MHEVDEQCFDLQSGEYKLKILKEHLQSIQSIINKLINIATGETIIICIVDSKWINRR